MSLPPSTRAPYSIITAAGGLEPLQTAWLRLWTQTEPPPPMLEYAWVREWWRLHHGEGQLFVVVVHDEEGTPLGLAPLYIRRRRLTAAQSLRAVFFLGTGEAVKDEVHGEHTGWLGPPAVAAAVSKAVAHALGSHPAAWDRLHFQHLWPDRGIAVDLPEMLRPNLLEWTVTSMPTFRSPTMRVDEYIERLPNKKMRSNCRRGLKLAAAEGIEFVRSGSTAEALAMLRALADLHQRRWQNRGASGAFGGQVFERFHRHMLEHYGAGQRPWLVGLRHKDRWIALEYHLTAADRLYDYIGGLDPTQHPAALSPGLILHLLAIDAAAQAGFRTYDFLGGDYEHKRRLALEQDELLTLECLQSTLKARVWRRLRNLRRRRLSSGHPPGQS